MNDSSPNTPSTSSTIWYAMPISRPKSPSVATICSLAPYVGTDAVLGFDAAGVELWRITRDSGRVPPTVTTAWHGMVYGYTDAGPLVLDGRTGQDRVASATTAPLLVNGYFAVGPDAPRTPEQRPNYRHPSRLVASPTAG